MSWTCHINMIAASTKKRKFALTIRFVPGTFYWCQHCICTILVAMALWMWSELVVNKEYLCEQRTIAYPSRVCTWDMYISTCTCTWSLFREIVWDYSRAMAMVIDGEPLSAISGLTCSNLPPMFTCEHAATLVRMCFRFMSVWCSGATCKSEIDAHSWIRNCWIRWWDVSGNSGCFVCWLQAHR